MKHISFQKEYSLLGIKPGEIEKISEMTEIIIHEASKYVSDKLEGRVNVERNGDNVNASFDLFYMTKPMYDELQMAVHAFVKAHPKVEHNALFQEVIKHLF